GRVEAAARHAGRLVDRWLLLAAGGVTPGLEVVDYGYYAGAQSLACSGDLSPCLAPHPQLQVWDLRAWAQAASRRPRFPAVERGDLAAVWAALSAGLPSFISPHLRFGRPAVPEAAPPDTAWLPAMRAIFPAIPDQALLALQGLGDNGAASGDAPAAGPLRRRRGRAVAAAGLGEMVRRAVRSSRPEARVSVVVRTVLTRPVMLRRTVASRAAASASGPLHEVLLSSERPGLEEAAQDLQGEFPGLVVRPVPGPRPAVPSRTANLIAGAQAATGDYVWMVDDDDVVAPDAPALIQGAVHSRYHPILIGDCAVFAEAATPDDGPEGGFDRSHPGRTYRAARWVTAFSGRNPVPICAVLYPRPIVQRAATGELLRHDLSQDYALLLGALNDPEAEVRVIQGWLADISLRAGPGADNATARHGPVERSASISGFLADALAPGAGYRVVLTHRGNEVARLTRENRELKAGTGRARGRGRPSPPGPDLPGADPGGSAGR
ncbi:MAG: hypothetical protein H6R33_324, partial [Actinobacteria bacterium]|nr:hypothetical protein [Actinomycetota bacterium]